MNVSDHVLSSPKAVTLKAFLDNIAQTIEEHHGAPTWVQAEVVSVQPRAKGYWTLEIQDTNKNGKKSASAQVMVWYQQVHSVISYFKRATGQDLAPGMKILLQVEASMSPEWGFRLAAKAIDPSWTLGQAQQVTNQLRTQLQEEGLWTGGFPHPIYCLPWGRKCCSCTPTRE